MNTANDLTLLVDDLAGHWTEPVLESLRAAGVRISVEMELEAWRTLKKVLAFELRWQRAFRLSARAHLSKVMDEVLCKTTLLVARKLEPQAVSQAFKPPGRTDFSPQLRVSAVGG